MDGLDPAIYVFGCQEKKDVDPRPSPRQSGFGRAGGTNPRKTRIEFVTAPALQRTTP
jgi:hypothetical protein